MVSCCVIGAGNHSRVQHGAPLAHLVETEPDLLRLAAVCDLDAEKAESYAAEFGFAATYTDFRRMIDREKPDAIVAVTPLELTLPLGSELLTYGIPLLLEKPPGQTVAEAEKLHAAATSSGTPHMVSFNRRFNPALQAARDWITETGRPAPRVISARMFRVARREATFITGTGIHLVDAVLSFTGPVDRIETTRFSTPTGGQGAASHLRSTTWDALISIAPDCGTMAETYELVGEDYAILADVHFANLRITAAGSVVLEHDFAGEPHYVANGSFAENRSFIRSAATGSPLSPDMVDGLLSMRVAETVDRGAGNT